MLITNGTCVSTIMMSSAGRRGNRRRHDSLSRGGLSFRCFVGEALTASTVADMATDASRAGRLRRHVLAVLDRRVDRAATRDHRRELLRALITDVLELRNADVLDSRQARPLGRARVVDGRVGDG